MSPAALGGPPHTRISPLNGGGPISTERGKQTSALDSMAGVNRVFPPLEELVSVRPDINIHSPLRKILEDGEKFAKSADTNLDFRHPDLALQEYIKASIVAVEIVPRHKDYPSVQSDRGELHRLYQGLTKRIRAQHEKFGEVKELIKENNARNGVKSASDRLLAENLPHSPNGVPNGHTRAQSTDSPLTNGSTSNNVHHAGQKIAPSIPPKKKPPIQPKPNGLHGKAIQTTTTNSPTDLAARFARLRTPESNGAVQDPRIRTQPISIPGEPEPTSISPVSSQSSNYTTSKPSGPREMPSAPTTAARPNLIPLDVPAMPRAPDPIYNSPARNEDTATTANLPSSAPRTSSYHGSGNKNYAPPISTVRPTPGPIEQTHDYFTPAHSVNGFSGPRKSRSEVNIPDSTTIQVEQLYEYLKLGSRALAVLLVDLRSREHFDNGHIMSQTIICVEPITLRHGLSGEELGDTLIIAPDSEQALYNRRHEFDLVVFYDQSSSSLGPSSASEGTLHQFATAVYEYGYEKRLKRPPMLLIGGLDAWVDLFGQHSLQILSAGKHSTANGLKTGQKVVRPLGRSAIGRTPRTTPAVPRRLESRPLTKDEEAKWSEAVNGDQAIVSSPISEDPASDEVYYARTTDDFMRRYPEVSTIQESMMSAAAVTSTEDSFNADFVSTIPRPPARPPPALPRQRSSGISDRGVLAHVPAHSADIQATTPKVTPGYTGLSNPGSLCYMNATLQALSVTPFLRDFLTGTKFPEPSRVPKKATEATRPPQLMCRNLQNLFFYLWCGEYTWLSPRTLHRYINAVHIGTCSPKTPRNEAFGGNIQHDATEFFAWLLDIVEDETNARRDNSDVDGQKLLSSYASGHVTFKDVQMGWTNVLKSYASPISANLRGNFGNFRQCTTPNCGRQTVSIEPFQALWVVPPQNADGSFVLDGRLEDWIRTGPNGYGVGSWENRKMDCEKCKAKEVDHDSYTHITYLPNYIQINLKRFESPFGIQRKIMHTARLPKSLRIDMEPCFVPEADRKEKDPERVGEKPPFMYEIYAVIHHKGGNATSGHYWTIAKSPDKQGKMGNWNRFDDTRVSAANFADIEGGPGSAYIYLLRRLGVDDELEYDQLKKYGIPET